MAAILTTMNEPQAMENDLSAGALEHLTVRFDGASR
jgi:hypothetical protein